MNTQSFGLERGFSRRVVIRGGPLLDRYARAGRCLRRRCESATNSSFDHLSFVSDCFPTVRREGDEI